MSRIVDCPRCGEGDERSIGLNACGLCGCRFTVSKPLTTTERSDLHVWLRHGRIGRGRTYEQEVERAKRIDAERSASQKPVLAKDKGTADR